MNHNITRRFHSTGLAQVALCVMLSLIYTACDTAPTDQIRPRAFTFVVVDGLDEIPHFPNDSAKQHTIDGMLQAAADLNINLLFQSDTAFETVQFFLDSLHSIDIDGIVYMQAYNQQAVDGINRSTKLQVPLVTIDISQENVNRMEPLVNITATTSIAAHQIVDHMQSQQQQSGLCIFDSVNRSTQRFSQLCQTLQNTTSNTDIAFEILDGRGALQDNDVELISEAIDQYDAIDTLLFYSIDLAQRYVQRVSSDRRSLLTIGTWAPAPYGKQELESRDIDFVIHEDFFARGYLALLHLSLYALSGQVAGVGLRHIESGIHIIAR